MTHSSGLQYSYDDLDLVCCHGVDGEGPWMGAEASKQGRRTRCASMPEGRHQLPTGELARTAEVTASAVNDETESKELKLMKSNVKVPKDLKEESVRGPHDLVDVDILRGASEADHLQTANCGSHAESRSDSNSGMSVANIFCASDSSGRIEKTIHGGDEVGTESNQSHDPNSDDHVLKSPHITHEEQQCTTISSNNGSPLSESAGDQPGKCPNDQETKEGHIAGHSGPPQTSVSTPNQCSTAGLEPQTDLPDVEEEKISTSCNADACVILPAGVLGCTVTIMDTCGVMSQASKAVEPVKTLEVEKSCDRGDTESWSAGSADKLDGLNGPKTQNENAGLHLRDSQGKAQDQRNCTGEQLNVNTREECAQAERSEEAADVGCGAITSSDDCFKGQCCSLTAKKLDAGCSEENHIKSYISHCVDQCLEMTTYASLPRESRDESSLSKKLACSLDQTVAQQLENSSIKLDTIPEVSHIEPDDISVPDPLENSSLTLNPDVQHVHVDDKHTANDLDDKNLPPCSTEVCHVFLPEELHSNHEAADLSESPGSEVADGQREHHTPVAASSRMEDEAAHTIAHSDTQLSGQPLDGRNDPGDQKEESVVKVRLRKVRQYIQRLNCEYGIAWTVRNIVLR